MEEVLCECGNAAKTAIVKKAGPNQGREFYGCATYPGGCKFFQWGDAAPSNYKKHNPKPKLTATPALEAHLARFEEKIDALGTKIAILDAKISGSKRPRPPPTVEDEEDDLPPPSQKHAMSFESQVPPWMN